MNLVRQTIHLPSAAVFRMDVQCASLASYIHSKNHNIGNEEIYLLTSKISPDCIIHIVNVEGTPDQYYFEQFDQRCLYRKGEKLSGKRVTQVCEYSFVDSVLDTYTSVGNGNDRFSQELMKSNPSRIFVRYVTPIMNNGKVNKILVCSRYKKIAQNGEIIIENSLDPVQDTPRIDNKIHDFPDNKPFTVRLFHDTANEIITLRKKLEKAQAGYCTHTYPDGGDCFENNPLTSIDAKAQKAKPDFWCLPCWHSFKIASLSARVAELEFQHPAVPQN